MAESCEEMTRTRASPSHRDHLNVINAAKLISRFVLPNNLKRSAGWLEERHGLCKQSCYPSPLLLHFDTLNFSNLEFEMSLSLSFDGRVGMESRNISTHQ